MCGSSSVTMLHSSVHLTEGKSSLSLVEQKIDLEPTARRKAHGAKDAFFAPTANHSVLCPHH